MGWHPTSGAPARRCARSGSVAPTTSGVYKHRGRSLVSAWPMVQGAPAPVFFTSKSQHDKGNLNFHVEVKSRNLDF